MVTNTSLFCIMSFINHSPKMNIVRCQLDANLVMISASRKISKGEEIFNDYVRGTFD